MARGSEGSRLQQRQCHVPPLALKRPPAQLEGTPAWLFLARQRQGLLCTPEAVSLATVS